MRGEKRDERRARIVQAARKRFSSSGFDGAAVTAIAEAAGMAAGTLYNYFPSKEALLVAVFEREIAELAPPGRTPRNVGEWARAALRRYARFPRERWRQFMAAFYRGSPADSLRYYETQLPLLQSLGRVIESELGRSPAPDRLRRVLFSTFYQGFLRWLNAGQDIDETSEEVAGDLEQTLAAWKKK